MRILWLLVVWGLCIGCADSADSVAPAPTKSDQEKPVDLEPYIEVHNDGLEAAVGLTAGAHTVADRVYRHAMSFQRKSHVPDVDRWDPIIMKAADNNKKIFLYTKVFIHVESHGNPYVVSATGCAGLMQFCFETAKGKEYKLVFNTEEIHKCRCRSGRCGVSRDLSKEIEEHELADELHMVDPHEFPCSQDDPRFDPEDSIKAGAIFVDKLRRRYRGNLYLMYVGYNSGPTISDKVFRRLDRNGLATPGQIAPHLREVLKEHYGNRRGAARANALVNIQFKKLGRIYDVYRHQPAFSGLTPESMSQWAL